MSDHEGANEVILKGMRIPTTGPVPDSNLKVFQGKVVTGDFTQDSDPLQSSWVNSDLSGGHGVEEMNESLDTTRYRLGTLYPRSPGMITKAHKVDLTTFSPTIIKKRFLGNIKDATGVWDIITTGSPTSDRTLESLVNGPIGLLTAVPVNQSVVFQGTSSAIRIVIPMGADGFALYSNAGALTNEAPDAVNPALQAATDLGTILIGVDVDGQFWHTTNPGNGWSQYSGIKLTASSTVRAMKTYVDRNGQPSIFVITDSDVYQFDPNVPAIITTDVSFPPHPHHGLAMEKWDGGLYFSVGTGVHRYLSGSLSSVGLDRDHGLPIEYAGHIVGGGLVGGYNGLYAFVTKPDLSSHTFPDGTPTAYSSVHEFTGSGWHMIWEEAGVTLVPHSMGISRVDEITEDIGFDLHWSAYSGTAGYHYVIKLPIGFYNPREKARTTGGYAPHGWLQTSKFDAGMQGYDKLASALTVTIDTIQTGAVLTITYRTDRVPDWTTLGIVTEAGRTSLPFGTLTDGIYPGSLFEHIEFRAELADSTNDAFILESMVLNYIKELPSSWSWTIDVDLSTPHIYSPEEINAHLEGILDDGYLVPLVVNGETHRVLMSQLSGARQTGADKRVFRKVSLLEIPQMLGTT